MLGGWAPETVLADLAASQRSHYQVASFRDLAGRAQGPGAYLVVDVRFAYEWDAGHLPGALNIPVPEIESFARQMKPGTEIWAHCAGGYRAAIAASLLSRRGLSPVLVDDLFDNASAAGLDVVRN